MTAILKLFNPHLLSNAVRLSRTWLERHRNSELLKSFRSDIQDDRNGGHLQILQKNISRTVSQIELKLVGRNRSDAECQNC